VVHVAHYADAADELGRWRHAPAPHSWFDGLNSSGGAADSVREMMHSASLPKLGSEFDAFLFAPVGDDRNGMPLTVLSALARQDVDPWQEAANLARSPKNLAIEQLTSFVAALPGRSAAQPDPGTIAARLIALLPGRNGSAMPSSDKTTGVGGITSAQSVKSIVALNLIIVAVMLGAQWMAVSHLPPTNIAGGPANASQTSPAPSLTPNPGQ